MARSARAWATAGLLTPISRAFRKSADYAGMAEQLSSGKLRALATASPTRIEALADVPTVAEFGYKDYGVDLWFGLVAPARTSKEIVSQLTAWFTAALQVPEIKAKLVAQGLYPIGKCGADFIRSRHS